MHGQRCMYVCIYGNMENHNRYVSVAYVMTRLGTNLLFNNNMATWKIPKALTLWLHIVISKETHKRCPIHYTLYH